MKYMETFSRKRIFDFSYVIDITGSRNLASETVQNYLRKGYIRRIKRNLYATKSFENGGVIPTKYEIASSITNSSFVSYGSALAFYGYYNQVSNEITVCSLEAFRDFSFDYINYHFRFTQNDRFVDDINGVRVSSLEKAIVDCIGDIKSYDDMEELLEALSMINIINGNKILDYLKYVNRAILYSKVGLILSFFEDGVFITKEILDIMKASGITKTRDFTREKHRLKKYYKKWKLHCYDINDFIGEEQDDYI